MTQLLEITLPGFRWLSVGSFVLGVVESVLLRGLCGAGWGMVIAMSLLRVAIGQILNGSRVG